MSESGHINREREIFLEALEQPSTEGRVAFIQRATAGDPELREAVEALLREHNQVDTFLEHGAAGLLRESMEAAGTLSLHEEQIGDFIGRYKLLEKIGEGGFGIVYRAEQSEPVRRQLALKVIKLGMDTKSVVARFEAERQALALMDHPGIARVLDAGATSTGRPYFVMELVRGVRITEYCEANTMRLEGRLTLFIQLCHAIQHAHQKGVIHRDLKPSNVLVTVQDGKPVPKVIDFGIAKALEEPLTEKTVLTNFHAFIGTPAYTSPEQAEMTGTDVDTRSDIYSLGVLLYELLTAVTPFDAKELTHSGLDGMRRMIKEIEPPKPSTQLRRLLAKKPANQGTLLVDRDVDWIVMKCLEKDRTRRYSTAQELAADLQRYLSQEPVLARPQSTAYRLHKAVRRHQFAFAAATAILMAVAAGTTVSVWQAFRATHAQQAEAQSRKSEALLRLKAELNEYVADINLAHQSILAGNLDRATEFLTKHRAEGIPRFEWRYLWHAAQGDDHQLLTREASSVLALANSPEWLVVGLQDTVRIYDAKTGSLVKTLAKSGTSVALSTNGLLATASKNAVRIWRTTDWTEIYSIRDHSSPVAFSLDGRLLAVNSWEGVCIYSSSDGKLVARIANTVPPFAFNPQGKVMAVDSSKGIQLWDVAAANMLRTLERSDGIFTNANSGLWSQNALVFSPDGHSVVAARNTLREGSIFVLDMWDSATGKKVASLPAHRKAIEHSGVISSVAFGPNGQLLASGSLDHSIRLWDVGSGQCVDTLYGNSSEIWTLAFMANGQGLISGAKDGTVRLWPTNAISKEKFYPGIWTPLKVSNDGQVLAAVDDHFKFVLLNLKTAEPEDQLQLSGIRSGPLRFWSRAISEDLRMLVEPSPKGGLRVWDLQSKKSTDLGSQEMHKPWWAAIAPDGSSFLAGGGRDSILWWNLRDLSAVPLRMEGKDALFSRNGAVLVTLHDQSFKLWDSRTRSLKAAFPVEADFGFGTAFALSDDGSILAAGSNAMRETENAIHLWDTHSGKQLGVCKGHTQGVRWLAFAPKAETLASVGDDSTFRCWNVRTQQELLSLQRLADPLRDILFSPDGSWLVAKTMTGLRLFNGSRDLEAMKTTALERSSVGQ